MRILLFEFITGGGLYGCHEDGPGFLALQHEAAAMRGALLGDLARIPDVSVTILHDVRLPRSDVHHAIVLRVRNATELWEHLDRESARADCVIAIAPETDSWLERIVRVVETAGVLLGPSASFVEMTADKATTKQWLRKLGVPCPATLDQDVAFERLRCDETVICKPTLGAGCERVQRIATADQLRSAAHDACFLEEFVVGRPMSISWLCGPTGVVQLQPCDQLIASGQQLTYCGSRVCTDERLVQRARRLVSPLQAPLTKQRGYVGVDLVLGDDDSGRGDVVIEINPRLTSSYVALREWHSFNIAERLLNAAFGSFTDRPANVL